ncbi:hypothetical protein [Changchengzhania lutea]|uniref:hypothetical protein n=1 Tax=Changchengzhania lutea TaxID=2049305 RepID=UPI00115E4EFD|nr:hypothetical protein [Changchengzhania lutea]
MKNENLFYTIGSTIILGAAIMKILDVRYANSILIFSFVGLQVFQSWHVSQLKKRINELEKKLNQ